MAVKIKIIKHQKVGTLRYSNMAIENPSFIDDFPSYLPPFSSGMFQPRLKTQWVNDWQILVIDAEGYPTCGNGGPHVATIHYTYNMCIYNVYIYILCYLIVICLEPPCPLF